MRGGKDRDEEEGKQRTGKGKTKEILYSKHECFKEMICLQKNRQFKEDFNIL